MRAMVGTEEPVDPAVARRPLPFSRVWMTAFILGVIGVGWTAILLEFDTMSEGMHVRRLDDVVTGMESAVRTEEAHLLVKGAEDLLAVTSARSESGAEAIDGIWATVEELTARARNTDRADLGAFSQVVQQLRAATNELSAVVGEADS